MTLFRRPARLNDSIFLTEWAEHRAAAVPVASSAPRPLSTASMAGIIAFVIALPIAAGLTAGRELLERPDARPIGGFASAWKVTSTAYQNGKELFSTIPSSRLTAGVRGSLMLNMQQPAASLLNKPLTVTATFWKGGDKIELASGQTVTSRNQSGAQTRILLPDFGLPLAGLWRIDVQLDGQTLGHTVLDIPNFPWLPSQERQQLVRQSGWVERNIALEGPSFTAGVPDSYTWYLLSGRKLSGSFKVEAIQQDSNKRRVLFEAPALGEPEYGASATVGSRLTLPKPGLWRLTAYVGGKVFGSLVVEAK